MRLCNRGERECDRGCSRGLSTIRGPRRPRGEGDHDRDPPLGLQISVVLGVQLVMPVARVPSTPRFPSRKVLCAAFPAATI
jgi:hypothetical protein